MKAKAARRFSQKTDPACAATRATKRELRRTYQLTASSWYVCIHALKNAIQGMSNTKPKAIPRLDAGENAAEALRLVAYFGWLRAAELGRLLYPKNEHGRKYAETHLRKLLTLRYVLARPLPGKDAGRAYVLTQRGANWLNDLAEKPTYEPGTKWGEVRDGVWSPPASWRHDLLAVGLLALLREAGWRVIPEAVIRKGLTASDKLPDGIAYLEGDKRRCLWIEVENQRKSGQQLEHMLRTVAKIERGKCDTQYLGVPPFTQALIAVPLGAKDERGHNINHAERIKNMVKKLGVSSTLQLLICELKLRGVGVESLSEKVLTIEPETAQ